MLHCRPGEQGSLWAGLYILLRHSARGQYDKSTMSHLILQQHVSPELGAFPHLAGFACRKIQQVHLNSFPVAVSGCLQVWYVQEGKFEWLINQRQEMLYPGDAAIVLPGQSIGSEKGWLDVGTCWALDVVPEIFEAGNFVPGPWSGLPPAESRAIGRLFSMNPNPVLARFTEAAHLFDELQRELVSREIGYTVRVNHRIDDLLIGIARQLSRQHQLQRDFPQTFLKLERALRTNLDQQWLVEEMAVLVGMGTTAFTEKVKAHTGFTPLHYLINIRIAEAIRLLKNTSRSVTDIALSTGFYSSQHFATTFKKLTGYTPRQFRTNHTGLSE